MVKNYDKNDNRVKLINGLAYIQAKDLTQDDSLMPLYTTIVKYKKKTKTDLREFILSEKNQKINRHNSVYRVFGLFHFKNIKGKVIHHKNFNPLDNTRENLQLLNNCNEHNKIHANTEQRKKYSSDRLKKYNNSEKGIAKRLELVRSEKMRKKSSETLKKWHQTETGKMMTQLALQKMNEMNKLKQTNSNPKFVLRRKKGKVRNIVQEVLNNNLELNKENYEKFRKNGYTKFDAIFEKKIFKDTAEILNYVKNYNNKQFINHKILKKEIINETLQMFCLSVEKFGNFALSAGVFVKNCGQGEPLLCDSFTKILRYLIDNKIFVGLVTNGSLLKERFSEIRIKPPQYISVSLNAPNALVHKQINGTNSFNTVLEGISLSVASGIDTYLSYVCTKQNLQHVSEFLKLAKSLKVKSVHLHNLVPHYKDENDEEFWSLVLTKQDENLIEQMKADVNASIVSRFPILISRNEIRRECRFPWKTLNFDGNGSISICPSVCEPKKENGNIKDYVIWHNDYCNDLRESILTDQKSYCKKCFRNWEV
jgi:MoaA/NifB/PqqE/SkfB family radical SAM enzyme